MQIGPLWGWKDRTIKVFYVVWADNDLMGANGKFSTFKEIYIHFLMGICSGYKSI